MVFKSLVGYTKFIITSSHHHIIHHTYLTDSYVRKGSSTLVFLLFFGECFHEIDHEKYANRITPNPGHWMGKQENLDHILEDRKKTGFYSIKSKSTGKRLAEWIKHLKEQKQLASNLSLMIERHKTRIKRTIKSYKCSNQKWK